MPDIKTLNIQTDAPQVRSPGVHKEGVGQAEQMRQIPSGMRIGAQILDDLSKMGEAAVVHYTKKEELLRQTISEDIKMNIAEEFIERLRHIKDQKGTQASGLLDDEGYHYGAYEGLKERYMYEDMDIRTAAEVKKELDSQFLQERKTLINHTLKQADIADKQTEDRRIRNAFSYINELDISDSDTYIREIEKQAHELTKSRMLRDPELNRDQVSKMYKEEMLYHGMIKSFMENPVAATKLWEEKEKYFEQGLPTKFDELATKYKSAKDDAKYDIADATLFLKHEGNYAAMAQDIEQNYKEYDIHADDALALGAKYRGIHNFNYTTTERVRVEVEDETLLELDKKHRHPDSGLMNLQPYLKDVEKAHRRGTLDKTTRDHVRNQAMTGELSHEKYREIRTKIEDGVITTDGQITRELAGRGTGKDGALYSLLKKYQADAIKGLTTNQLDASEQTYMRMVGEAEGPDPSGANDFRNKLSDWAQQQGYSSLDPRIHEEALRRLDKGWYYKYKSIWDADDPGKAGPFRQDPMGPIDRAAAIFPGTWTEKGFRWQHEAEPGVTSPDGTATGGSPKAKAEPDEETKAAVKYLADKELVIDATTIEKAKQILEIERKEKEKNAAE